MPDRFAHRLVGANDGLVGANDGLAAANNGLVGANDRPASRRQSVVHCNAIVTNTFSNILPSAAKNMAPADKKEAPAKSANRLSTAPALLRLAYKKSAKGKLLYPLRNALSESSALLEHISERDVEDVVFIGTVKFLQAPVAAERDAVMACKLGAEIKA